MDAHRPPHSSPRSDAGVALTDEIQFAHATAEDQDADGYADPLTGLFVFTRAALLRSKRCCGSGCRHCPFR